MKFKRTIAFLLTAVLALSLFAGCGNTPQSETDDTIPEPTPSEPVEVRTLRLGTLSTNDVFNVLTSSGAFGTMMFAGFTRAALVTKGADGNPSPYFMQTWKFADDGMSLEFTFPSGVKFHDGTDVTPDDVKFTIDYYSQYVKYSGMVGLVTGCELIDDNTAVMRFSEPCGIGFLKAIMDYVFIIPKHIWENVDGAEFKKYAGEDAAIGCGPYKLIDVDEDAQISYYEAMPDYFYGEITVPKVSLQTYNDLDAILMAMQNDEIDAYYQYSTPMPASMAPAILNANNLESGLTDTSATYQIAFGANKYPSNDVEFRKAIAYSVDWDMMANTIAGDYASVGTWGAVPPTSDAFVKSSPVLTKDIEKAKEILETAGYKDIDGDGIREDSKGSKMEIAVMPHYSSSTIELRIRLCEVLVRDLAAVGIAAKVEEQALANNEYSWPLIESGEYDLLVGYTTSGKADYETAFFYFLGDYDTSYGHFNIPEMSEQVKILLGATTEEEYLGAAEQLQKLNENYVVGLPLAYSKVFFPYSTTHFEGWEFRETEGAIHSGTWFAVRQK